MRLDGPAATSYTLPQPAVPDSRLQHFHAIPAAHLTDAQGSFLIYISRHLVVYLQEQFRIVRMQCKFYDIADVQHHPVSEESQFCIPDPVGNPLPLQSVHKGEHTLVIPVEHCRLHLAIPGHFSQVGILGAPALQGHQPDLAASLPYRPHMFLMAQGIVLDKAVCSRHNPGVGTVVLLHQQYLRPRMLDSKVQQGLRVGRPEAIDALVLVPYQEEIVPLPGQQGNDPVLDPGSILGLIHTDILIPLPEVPQGQRTSLQDPAGIHHLVIVIHQPLPAQFPTVSLVYLPDPAVRLLFQPVNLFGRQHPVLDICDPSTDILQVTLCGELPFHTAVDLCQYATEKLLVCHQAKGILPDQVPVITDDLGADTIDGAEFQPPFHLFPEEGPEAGRHIPGSCHGICQCQDLLRLHLGTVDHISQPGYQHGGLPTPWHGQHQHRAGYRPDCLLLLGIKVQAKLPAECFACLRWLLLHCRLPLMTLQIYHVHTSCPLLSAITFCFSLLTLYDIPHQKSSIIFFYARHLAHFSMKLQ